MAAAPRSASGSIRIRVSARDPEGNSIVLIIQLPQLELVGEIRGTEAQDAFQRYEGDVDDDGTVGVNDLDRVLAALGTFGDDLPADLDGNGLVDAGDLMSVLSHLGTQAPWVGAIAAPQCAGPCTQRSGAPLNGDALPPLIQAAGWQGGLDCDGDGDIDTSPLPFPPGDCDGDGVPDPCEILMGAPDCDHNGVPDDCQEGNLPMLICPMLSTSRLELKSEYRIYFRQSRVWSSLQLPPLPYPPFDSSSTPHEVPYKCTWGDVIAGGQGLVVTPRIIKMEGALDLLSSTSNGAIWRGIVGVEYSGAYVTEPTEFCPPHAEPDGSTDSPPWFYVTSFATEYTTEVVTVWAGAGADGVVQWYCSLGHGAWVPIGSGGCSGFSWGIEQGQYDQQEGVPAAGPLGSVGGVHDYLWRTPSASLYKAAGVSRTEFTGSVTAMGGAGTSASPQGLTENGCCEIVVVDQSGVPEPFCAPPGGSLSLHASGGNPIVADFEWHITAGDAVFVNGGSSDNHFAVGPDVTIARGPDPSPVTILVQRGCWKVAGIGVRLVPDPATHLDSHAALVLPGDSEKVFAYAPAPVAYRYKIANDAIAKFRTSQGMAGEVTVTGPPNGAATLDVVGLQPGVTVLQAIHPTQDTVCGALVVHVGGQVNVEFDRYPTFRIDPPLEPTEPEPSSSGLALMQANPPAFPTVGIDPYGSLMPHARGEVRKDVLDSIAAVAGAGAPATIRVTVLDAEGHPKRNKEVSLRFRGIPTSPATGTQQAYVPAIITSTSTAVSTRADGSVEIITQCKEDLYQELVTIAGPFSGFSPREAPFVRDPMVVLVGTAVQEAQDGVLSQADIRSLASLQPLRVQDGTNTGHSVRYERALTSPSGERIAVSVAIDMLAINHTQFALLDKFFMGTSPWAPESADVAGMPLDYQAQGNFGTQVPQPPPDQDGLLESEEFQRRVMVPFLEQWRSDHPFECQNLNIQPVQPGDTAPGGGTATLTTSGVLMFEYARMAAIVAGDVVIGLIPIVGDGYSIVSSLWNYWVHGEQVDKLGMILSVGGLLMDLADFVPPVGAAANAVMGGLKGLWHCLKEFDPQLTEFLIHHLGSVRETVEVLFDYVVQSYNSLPAGLADPVEIAVGMVSGTLGRVSAMANAAVAIPMEVQTKIMKLVGAACSRQLSEIAHRGLGYAERFLPGKVAGVLSKMGEREGKEVATEAVESMSEALAKSIERDLPGGGGISELSQLGQHGGTRVEDAVASAERAALEGFTLGQFGVHVQAHIGPGKAFATVEDFLVCQRCRKAELRDIQVSALNEISQAMHSWGPGKFKRIIPDGAELPKELSGFCAREADIAHLGPSPTTQQLRDELRLDYGSDTTFPPDKGYWEIEVDADQHLVDRLKVPKGDGFVSHARDTPIAGDFPYLGNGGTAAKSGRITPEYYAPGVGLAIKIPEGSKASRRSASGQTTEVWQRVGQDDEGVWVQIQ